MLAWAFAAGASNAPQAGATRGRLGLSGGEGCMAAEMAKLYPEIKAGGFARNNGGVQFHSRVNALLEPDMTVVDLGAGRGTVFHTGVDSYYERLLRLQGKVARVIGIDVDDGIVDHPYLDERHVIE